MLETSLAIKLPIAYVDFLKTAGHNAGKFWDDVDFKYESLMSLQEEARDILDNWEHGELQLPPHAFVFSMRQGEQFMFFDCGAKDNDPPIYYYMEGSGQFKRIADSIWDVIESELGAFEEWNRTIQEHGR